MAAGNPPEADQRRILSDLRNQGQSALTWGLPNPVTESVVVGIGILLRDQLADTGVEARASKAAEIASSVLDKTMSRMPQADTFACRKGCSFCCHTAVPASAPEVLRIAGMLADGGGPDPAAVLAACKAGGGASVAAMLGRADACPLLIEGACSVHAVRPLACRQYVSTSAEECEATFEGKRDTFPFVPGATNAGVVVRSLLLGAAHSLGREPELYDLSSALVIALETREAERRWLAGADVFAAAVKLPRPPQMQTSIERWSPMLTTFVEGG